MLVSYNRPKIKENVKTKAKLMRSATRIYRTNNCNIYVLVQTSFSPKASPIFF